MKKKTLILSIIILVAAAIAAINVFQFFRSTISVDNSQSYCASKSQKQASAFDSWKPGGEPYIYMVALDANAGKAQELCIFEQTFFNRLKPLANSVDSNTEEDAPVGVYRFHTYDKSGKDNPLYSLVLFSANKDAISRIVYTLSTNGIDADIEMGVALMAFAKTIPNLGTINNVTTQVTHIKFYSHYDDRLVYEWDSPFSPQ